MRHLLTLAGATILAATAYAGTAGAVEITPSASDAGSPAGPFTIDRFSQTYGATVSQTIVGAFDGTGDTFTENGVFTVNAFQNGGSTVLGTGLNASYQVYGTFLAQGTAASGCGGTCIESDFTTFNVALFLDKDLNTTVDTTGGGSIGGATGDDVQIAAGVINAGGINDATTYLNGLRGDFEVLVDFTASDPFFQGSPFTLLLALDGTVNVLQGPGAGYPDPGTYDILVQGDGRGVFEVPEPASLGLLGIGLLGLGLASRRRRAAA